ncbi:MAG: hypothetical protein R3B57_00115 [Phycisphaerales bacterium]
MTQSAHPLGRRALVAIAAWVCLGGALAGCANRRAEPTPTSGADQTPATTNSAPEPAALGPRGLEVQVWIVDDLGGQVAGVLSELEEPASTIDAGDARRWRDSGLRVVGVSPDQVDRIRDRLQLAAPVRREWLGQVLAWRALAQGPGLNRERIATATGPVWVDAGSLRLMARAWASPRVRPGRAAAADLRLELVPQLVVPKGAQTLSEIESRLRGELPTPSEDGPILERLALAVGLDGSEALIIVGEAPDADWVEQARLAKLALEPVPDDSTGPHVTDESEDATPDWRGATPSPGRVADPWEEVVDAVGPGAPEARTLGESMLSGRLPTRIEEVGEGRVLRPRRRALIVLIPHASGAYTIVPTPQVAAP